MFKLSSSHSLDEVINLQAQANANVVAKLALFKYYNYAKILSALFPERELISISQRAYITSLILKS